MQVGSWSQSLTIKTVGITPEGFGLRGFAFVGVQLRWRLRQAASRVTQVDPEKTSGGAVEFFAELSAPAAD